MANKTRNLGEKIHMIMLLRKIRQRKGNGSVGAGASRVKDVLRR